MINNTLSIEEIKWLGELLPFYKPLSKSMERFHDSKVDFKWLFGGNQASKTYTNMMDLTRFALNIHSVKQTEGPSVSWACTESFELCRDILWTNYLEKFIPEWHIRDIRYGQDRVPRKIILNNANVIEFKAFNQKRGHFQGRAIDACYCDEQCIHDFQGILNEIEARLLKRSGYLSWSMTPIIPQSLLEERISDLPDTDDVFYADLNDNRVSRGGYIPDERIDAMIAEWPEEVQATRIAGKFASYYGAVYKTFSRHIHVIKPFAIPKEWPRYRGFDFGFTNPFVSLWMTHNKDDDWYVYREYYKAQTGICEHIEMVKKLSNNEIYVNTWADPEDASARHEMREAGILTRIAKKDIDRGIESVQTKLKVKPNGKPSLYFFDTCRNTCREMAGYQRSQGTRTNNPRETPIQKDDHTIDVVRYIIFSETKSSKRGSVFAA